jgi:hypothetical protein
MSKKQVRLLPNIASIAAWMSMQECIDIHANVNHAG